METEGKVIGPGAGRKIDMYGVMLRFLAEAGDTDGAWTLFEYSAPAGFPGPPAHWHNRTLEAFFVMEGRMQFRVGEATVEAEPGSFILVPLQALHTFSNPHAEPAKFLVLMSPGGFEGYFDELMQVAATSRPGTPEFAERVRELAARYDAHLPTES